MINRRRRLAKFVPSATGYYLRMPIPVQTPSPLHCAIVNAVLKTDYYQPTDTSVPVPAIFAAVPGWCTKYLGYIPRPVFLSDTSLEETFYEKRSSHNAAWERESRHLEFRNAVDAAKWAGWFPAYAAEADGHDEERTFQEAEREFAIGWEWHAIRYGMLNPRDHDMEDLIEVWPALPCEEYCVMSWTAQSRSTDSHRSYTVPRDFLVTG